MCNITFYIYYSETVKDNKNKFQVIDGYIVMIESHFKDLFNITENIVDI